MKKIVIIALLLAGSVAQEVCGMHKMKTAAVVLKGVRHNHQSKIDKWNEKFEKKFDYVVPKIIASFENGIAGKIWRGISIGAVALTAGSSTVCGCYSGSSLDDRSYLFVAFYEGTLGELFATSAFKKYPYGAPFLAHVALYGAGYALGKHVSKNSKSV